ncbi:MAG: 50S ribosomal protein L24 [bacterium]|nr:50S ribosomal protein L24 [bacterium]
MKIKKGDNIIVISGKERGKTGAVSEVFPKLGKVIVSGLNMAKRHKKASKTSGKGQIVEVAMPVDVSNVSLVENGKPVRVGYKMEGDKKIRVSKKSGSAI